jgi:hypothetical protein
VKDGHDPERAYIVDAVDRKACELYRLTGFAPPTRPLGWLDANEKATWESWRTKAAETLAAENDDEAA